MLRVLLVLASGGAQRRRLGVFRGTPSGESASDGGGDSLLSFLYLNCLFPKDVVGPDGGGRVARALVGAAPADVAFGAMCQTRTSRALAYTLIFQLCRYDDQNLLRIVHIMNSISGDPAEADGAGAAAAAAASASDKHRGPPSVSGSPVNHAAAAAAARAAALAAARKRRKVKRVQWEYDPGQLVKDGGFHVGLVNQGGTCYMNSLLQQLYHTPAFADGLLSIDSNALGADGAAPSDNENMLFQLQVLFGYLRLSQKRFYDTLSFCQSFIDYDGHPISLFEQKDINEFAGMLFDKLESNPDCAALLARTLRVKAVWKTRSTETPYRSDREETFYMVTVEVKDKACLEDSLDLYVAEELFSGDNKLEDPDAGRKVDALRRCAFRELPPTLIIHLKRFEFDLETMDRKKVNDLITFPLDLDMFPYTEEGLAAKEAKLRGGGLGLDDDSLASPAGLAGGSGARPESYYRYKLKGVVAHVGAIDRGHYYSFINAHPHGTHGSGGSGGGGGGSGSGGGARGNGRDGGGDRWLEFNDRSVLPFSAEAIAAECFGGEDPGPAGGAPQPGAPTTKRMRQNNAYLLVYERQTIATDAVDVPGSPAPAVLAAAEVHDDGKKVGDAAASAETTPVVASSAAVAAPPSQSQQQQQQQSGAISRRVLQVVERENVDFQTDRCLFDRVHFSFVWQLQHAQVVKDMLERARVLAAADASAEMPAACDALPQLALACLRFNVEVLSRARAGSCVHLFFEALEELVIQDASRRCAEALVVELAADTATLQGSLLAANPPPAGPPEGIASGAVTSTPPRGGASKTPADASSTPRGRQPHPWLASMFLQCPHGNTVKAFSRLLLTCIKVLRPTGKDKYVVDAPVDADGAGRTPDESHEKKEGMETKGDGNDGDEGGGNEGEVDGLDGVAAFADAVHECAPGAPGTAVASLSSVARLFQKLLLLLERLRAEDVVTKDGYKMLSSLLLQVASLGLEEKAALLRLGAVRCLVHSLLTVNPSATQIAADEVFCTTDLAALLVRAAFVPRSGGAVGGGRGIVSPRGLVNRPDSASAFVRSEGAPDADVPLSPFLLPEVLALPPDQARRHVQQLQLSYGDLSAYLSRVFLEDAVTTSTAQTAQALQHVCWSRGPHEAARVVAFLAEKVSECAMQTTGVDLAYRPYFRCVSELLLSRALGSDSSFAFDSVLPALLAKADVLVGRQCPNDADYVYAVMKLLHRLGTSGGDGHRHVLRLRELWKAVKVKAERTQRRAGPIAVGISAFARGPPASPTPRGGGHPLLPPPPPSSTDGGSGLGISVPSSSSSTSALGHVVNVLASASAAATGNSNNVYKYDGDGPPPFSMS
jgi:ubiquitin C-terminal hydrolase